MRRINLGIDIDDLEVKEDEKGITGIKVAENYITSAFNWLQTTPKNHGDPRSAGLTVSDHRKMNEIFTAINNQKANIIELEDNIYEFLKSTFSKVQWTGGTKIIVRVADAIDNVLEDDQPTLEE